MKQIIILSAFILVSISTVFGQNDSLQKQTNGPYMSFQSQTHDFGKIIFSEPAIFDFTFTNTGNAPLKISSVKSTCGCTVPKWSEEEIAPNETGVISIKYDSKRSGEFIKGITIYSNATNGDIVLIIKGEVTPNLNKPILGE